MNYQVGYAWPMMVVYPNLVFVQRLGHCHFNDLSKFQIVGTP